MTASRLSCPNCGHSNPPDSDFCEECGTDLERRPVQTQPEPPPPPFLEAPPVPPPFSAPPGPPPPAQRSGSKPWLVGGLACAGVAALLLCLAAVGGVFYFRSRTAQVTPTVMVALPIIQGLSQQTDTPVAEPQPPVAEPDQPIEPAQPTETPVPAGPARIEYTQDGISFSYDPALATGVIASMIEPQVGDDLPNWELAPRHRALMLEGYPLPPDAMHLAQIFIYPVEEYYAVDPSAGDRLATLQQMLSSRATANLPSPLPFFPSWPAGQVLAARVGYLDFEGGAGVTFLSQYGQDIFPINNMGLFYTFQALTSDNRWLIAAVMPVSSPALPDPEVVMQDPNFYDNYLIHLAEMTELLESQPAGSFSPSLTALDELFRSIRVR